MKNFLLICVLAVGLFSCKDKPVIVEDRDQDKSSLVKVEQKAVTPLDIYNFSEFESFLNKKDDTIYVLNFWATWCAPCVKELPYFEEVNEKYKDKNVEVILVSLDFPKQYEKKLIPFIQKHNLKSKVIALNDTKMNDWIPKVDADWSGAIPATIIYNKDKRQFYERSFTFEELENELQKFTTH